MREQIDDREPQSTRDVRAVVVAWLDRPAPPGGPLSKGLRQWLHGRGLPPVNRGDEPWYIWVMRGLPLGAARAIYEPLLAEQAGALLEERPDLDPAAAPAYLWNLLKLCAALSCPDQLNEPLDRLFHRTALRGEFEGLPLTTALYEALRENQTDSRYKSIWLDMLRHQPHPFIGGDVYDGFWGVLWMPASRASRGVPVVDAVREALLAVALELDASPRRVEHITSFIASVVQAYPSLSQWRPAFFDLTLHADWPVWARAPLLQTCLAELTTAELAATAAKIPAAMRACLERIALGEVSLGALERRLESMADHNAAHLVTEASRLTRQAQARLDHALERLYDFEFKSTENSVIGDLVTVTYKGKPLPLNEAIAGSRWAIDRAKSARLKTMAPTTAGRLHAMRSRFGPGAPRDRA
jgi:hypothetical protein